MQLGRDLEILPLLYALLAAITGINAGDRAVVAVRAPVEASASTPCAAQELGDFAAVQALVTKPATPIEHRIVRVETAPALQNVAKQVLFAIATFATRLE